MPFGIFKTVLTLLGVVWSTIIATLIELKLFKWFLQLLSFLDLVEIHNDLIVGLLLSFFCYGALDLLSFYCQQV